MESSSGSGKLESPARSWWLGSLVGGIIGKSAIGVDNEKSNKVLATKVSQGELDI